MKKLLKTLFLAVLISSLFAGCSIKTFNKDKDESKYSFYYLNASETVLKEEPYEPKEETTEFMVKDLMQKLGKKEVPDGGVSLLPEEVSLAIGKGGLNIKLATMLTGYQIDVYRFTEDSDDIYLDEFSDEIDSWVIDALKGIGCTTAKAVLNMPREQIIDKADLEESTVDQVLDILKAEFED